MLEMYRIHTWFTVTVWVHDSSRFAFDVFKFSSSVDTLHHSLSKHTVVTLNCTRVRLIDCRFGTQLGWLLNRLCRHYCESSGCEVDERVKSSFQEPRSRTLNSVWKAKHIRRAAQHYDNEFCDSLVSPLRQQSALFRGSWHTCSTHDGRRKQHIIYFITFLACIKTLILASENQIHEKGKRGKPTTSREWEEELRTLVWVFFCFGDRQKLIDCCLVVV